MPNNVDGDTENPSSVQRLKKELFKYGLVSGYLFVCFSTLLLYEATLAGGGHQTLPFGLALVKALVLGKFLLIGEALKAGSRADAHSLLHRIIWKSLAFLVVLLIFTALEELIVGWFHGKTAAEIIDEFLMHSWLENLAPVVVILLILVPLISISEIYRQLGPNDFKRLLLTTPPG